MQLKIGNKIIMEVSADDIFCLDNDLLSSKDWLQAGLRGKINQCKKRLFRQWIPILRERSLDIPATDSALIDLIKSQPDYKDRRNREEAEEGQTVKDVCLDSNKLAKSSCPWTNTKTIIYISGTEPIDDCDVH